jgi:hypothetical protein
MAELPDRLRAAADAHLPDRERMLARVERAIAAGPQGAGTGRRERPPAPWLRVTAVAAAVAGAIGLGGLAVGAVSGDRAPGGHSAATSGSTGTTTPPPVSALPPGPATTTGAPRSALHGRSGSTPTGAAGSPGRASGAPPTGTRAPVTPPGSPVATGGAGPSASGHGGVTSSAGVDPNSNRYWTESDVHLGATSPLTSLTVELRISQQAGAVSSNSSYTTAPGTTVAVSSDGGYLVYRWTLNAGSTLAPGSYTFAGQFNHAEGDRDTSGDRYRITAQGAGGQAVEEGHF